MASRLQIARARARVALARKTGEQLPAEVFARAALEFGVANEDVASRLPKGPTTGPVRVATARVRIALSALSGRTPPEWVAGAAALRSARTKALSGWSKQPRLLGSNARPRRDLRDPDYRTLAGVHAHGRDFGPVHQARQAEPSWLPPDEEEALIDERTITRASWERAKAAVRRGELEALQRRSRQAGLVATMSSLEVEDWLGIGSAKRVWMLSVGELFAFVADDELRYPTWQFIDDPGQRILPHLSRLITAFDDGMHPASILRFMTTPRDRLRLEGEPACPVDWLLRGGDVQELVEILETQFMS